MILACLAMSCLGLAKIRMRRGLLVCGCFVLAGVLLMVARRMLPFERVFLFAVPFYVCLLATGASEALRLAFRLVAAPAARRLALPVAAVVLGLLSAGQLVLSDAIPCSYAHAPGIPEVARFLSTAARPNDMVAAGIPAKAPLSLYLEYLGIDGDDVNRSKPSAKRVYVVVTEGIETPQNVLDRYVDRCPVAGTPQFVGRIGGFGLFLIESERAGL
jgi:hypothetical protein